MAEVENVRQYPIKKSNELIQKTSFMLSAQEYDILQYLVMKIKDDDEELKPCLFSIKEFCKIAGIQESGDNYNTVKNSLRKLKSKNVWLETGDGWEECVSWVDKVKVNEGQGSVVVKIDKFWQPYLLDLKKYYTVTTLYDTLPMKSVYGKRIYELLNSHLLNNQSSYIEFEVEEIKKILLGESAKKKYKKFGDFRIRVLKPAMEDLEEFGQLDVKMELKRCGRSFKYVYFKIRFKKGLALAESSKKCNDYFKNKR